MTTWANTTAIVSGKRWAGRTGFSLLDQALVSLSNFLISILFARWLAPADFGALAIVFTIFLFFSGFHNALILEPMSVLARRHYLGTLDTYLQVSVLFHLVFSVVLSLVLLGAALLAKASDSLASSLQALAYTVPFILLFWQFRRTCYVRLTPKLAALGSVAYSITLLLGLTAARHFSLISVSTPFVVMAVASIAACVILALLLGFHRTQSAPITIGFMQDIWRRHWNYGRWIVGATVFVWIANSILPSMFAVLAGLEDAGQYRAAEILFQPLMQSVTAVSMFMLPWLSNHDAPDRKMSLSRFVSIASTLTAVVGLVYVLMLSLAGQSVLNLVYGSDQYDLLLAVLPIFGLGFTVRAITAAGLATAMRASGHSKAVFWASVLGAATTLLIGTMLVQTYGLRGSAYTVLLSSVTQAIVFLRYFNGITKPQQGSFSTP